MTTERDADAAWEALLDEFTVGGLCGQPARNHIKKHRPRIEAALRAQGDSASTPEHVCDYKKLTGYDVDMAQPRYHWAPDGMHLDPVGPYVLGHTVGDSATTEGAVLDVDVLAKALRAAEQQNADAIGVVGPADQGPPPEWYLGYATAVAANYRALLADVPDETASVDPRVAEAFDLLGGMWSWHDDPTEPASYLYNSNNWATRAGRLLREVVGRPAKPPSAASGTGAGESQS